ncbi:MAG: hypothetical protein ACYTFY_17555, partial [Planctomycetota bacterium]
MDSASLQKAKSTCAAFNTALFLKIAIEKAALWMYLIAGTIVTLKLSGLHKIFPLHYLLYTGTAALVWIINIYIKQRYSIRDAACWLDLKEQAGGSYIASVCNEKDCPVTRIQNVSAGIKGEIFLIKLLLPGIILAAAFLISGVEKGRDTSSAAVRKKLQVVEKNISEVERHEIIPEERISDLREALIQLDKGLEKRPETAVEGIDNLQKNLDEALVERAEQDAAGLRAAEELLSKMLKEMTAENSKKVSGEELAKAAEALKNITEADLQSPDIQEMLKKMGLKNCE